VAGRGDRDLVGFLDGINRANGGRFIVSVQHHQR
jgi:hypothetical protein